MEISVYWVGVLTEKGNHLSLLLNRKHWILMDLIYNYPGMHLNFILNMDINLLNGYGHLIVLIRLKIPLLIPTLLSSLSMNVDGEMKID